MSQSITAGESITLIPDRPLLFAEGSVLSHIYVVESGKFRLKMRNPKCPREAPIVCCDLGEGSIFGWELVMMDAAQVKSVPPPARFTIVLAHGPIGVITRYEPTQYRAVLLTQAPEISMLRFFEERESWFKKRVIARRDELADKNSSGTRRISQFMQPTRSPSTPGMKIPVPETKLDYDTSEEDTNPGRKVG